MPMTTTAPGRLDGKVLPDLARVLREIGGRTVDESPVPDWRIRSRGGNTQWYTPTQVRKLHIMMHDTATSVGSHDSLADEQAEARRMRDHPEAKPCSNVYLGPSGRWYPVAGGPANTNGSGHDWWGGGIPDDSMNSYSIAIEFGNNGVGEPWQQQSWDSYLWGVAAMCVAYQIDPHNVRCHFEWAPTRKIDLSSGPPPQPAVANAWALPGDRYGRFVMDLVRAEVARRINQLVGAGPTPTPIPPLPTTGDDEVFLGIYQSSIPGSNEYEVWSGGKKNWITDQGHKNGALTLCDLSQRPRDTVVVEPGLMAALGTVDGPNAPQHDQWGNFIG